MTGPDYEIVAPDATDVGRYRRYLLENRAATASTEPQRPDAWYEDEAVHARLLPPPGEERYIWIACTAEGHVVGEVTLGNVVRGSYQNAYLGVTVHHEHSGRGLATKLVAHGIDAAFEQLDLHRVEGSTLVGHTAILRLTERVGMRQIGVSPFHVHVNGAWRDQILYAITIEQWRERRGIADSVA